ncbi:hypothetical protein F5Y13DRAFT_194336 [Hypoxylon sp. FL1857]|nr:hypothetical protein F5Y13DRAFT_194336 [Hypoxylon sp. FL1857]
MTSSNTSQTKFFDIPEEIFQQIIREVGLPADYLHLAATCKALWAKLNPMRQIYLLDRQRTIDSLNRGRHPWVDHNHPDTYVPILYWYVRTRQPTPVSRPEFSTPVWIGDMLPRVSFTQPLTRMMPHILTHQPPELMLPHLRACLQFFPQVVNGVPAEAVNMSRLWQYAIMVDNVDALKLLVEEGIVESLQDRGTGYMQYASNNADGPRVVMWLAQSGVRVGPWIVGTLLARGIIAQDSTEHKFLASRNSSCFPS